MSKKLSEIWIKEKQYLSDSFDMVMDIEDVKTYGEIKASEERLFFLNDWKAGQDQTARKLQEIAIREGIKDYKI